ncbi:hypothetical protein [Zoogloea sp.]|uniref:hypothetical protein n=1 Tax=Zoogloea sp. TaxID=49181 RepID=UPI002634A5B7|nr:hypothetical protein [Zoogloea sp.]MDD3353730.1 hypothetical protein [Zoogloea sp.]
MKNLMLYEIGFREIRNFINHQATASLVAGGHHLQGSVMSTPGSGQPATKLDCTEHKQQRDHPSLHKKTFSEIKLPTILILFIHKGRYP